MARETAGEKLTVVLQARDAGGLDKGGSPGDGSNWIQVVMCRSGEQCRGRRCGVKDKRNQGHHLDHPHPPTRAFSFFGLSSWVPFTQMRETKQEQVGCGKNITGGR